MSRIVDERIAKMKLDNADFKSKASETINLFGKLTKGMKQSENVDFNNSTSGINRLASAVAGVGMEGLQNGVMSTANKFTALEVAAVTAIANITSRIFDMGLAFAKSITTEPIMTGFSEMEEKMNSIQVILANTQGKSTLDEVTASLDDLNKYADLTIYSFAEMTKNIGTFTAAGVDLQTSQTAIKGIGNLAATSGSNAQQAATAMYQLSQAIAAGSVKLQDWNSVVNAGMGGKLFQDALRQTAQEMGKGIDASENFRESLQKGWVTTDVLMKTLEKFSKDETMLEAATKVRTFTQMIDTLQEAAQSGWGQTWEILLGDFKTSGDMWTSMNNVISDSIEKSAEARNAWAQTFIDLGGRAKIIETVKNAWVSLTGNLGTVKSAFRDVFPKIEAQQVIDIIQKINELIGKTYLDAGKTQKLYNIAKGFASALDIVYQVAKRAASVLKALIPDSLGGGFIDLVEKIALFITKLDESLKSGEKFKGFTVDLHDTVNKMAEGIAKAFEWIGKAWGNVKMVIDAVWSALQPIFSAVGKAIKDVVSELSFDDVLSLGFIGILWKAIKSLTGWGDKVKDVIESVKDMFDGLEDKLGIFDTLSETLNAFTNAVKVASLVAIAGSIFTIAVSLKMLENIKGQDLAKGLGVVAASLFMMTKAMKAIADLNLGIGNTISAVLLIGSISMSLLVLSGVLKILATIDPEDIGNGLLTIAGTLGILVLAMKGFSKIQGNMVSTSASLLILSGALLVISQVLKQLSVLEPEELGKSTVVLGAVLLELAAFSKLMTKSKINMGTATSIVLITAAIWGIAQVMKDLGQVPTDEIEQGLVAIGVVLLELAAFALLTSGLKLNKVAGTMIVMAGAIWMLVDPIKQLGAMDGEALTQALTGLGVVLLEIAAAMLIISAGKAQSGALGILIVAGAIRVLTPALMEIGRADPDTVVQALVGLGAALLVIAVASKLVGPAGAAVLMGIGLGMAAIGVGVVGVGAGLLLLGAGLVKLVEAVIEAFSGIIKIIKDTLVAIQDLTPLAVETIVKMVVEMAKGIAQGLPELLKAVGDMINAIIQWLIDFLPEFFDKGYKLIEAIGMGIVEYGPKLIELALQLILSLIFDLAEMIRNNSEPIVDAVLLIIEAILEIVVVALTKVIGILFGWIPGVKDAMKEAGDSGVEALREAFDVEELAESKGKLFGEKLGEQKESAKEGAVKMTEGATEGIKSMDFSPEGVAKGIEFSTGVELAKPDANNAATSLVNEMTASVNNAAGPIDAGANKGQEVADGMASKTTETNAAGADLVAMANGGALNVDTFSTGEVKGQDLANGFGTMTTPANIEGANLAIAAKNGAESVDATDSGRYFGQGFANGIQEKQEAVDSVARGLGAVAKAGVEAMLGIFSPSRVMRKDGGYFGEGFALGIQDSEKEVEDRSKNLASRAVDAVRTIADDINDYLSTNMDLQPAITPVVDLSNVRSTNFNALIPAAVNANIRGGEGSTADQNITNNYINIYSSDTDPRKLAYEVERIITRR